MSEFVAYHPTAGMLTSGDRARRLWVQVFLRSTLDAVSFKNSPDREKQGWARGAWAWLHSEYTGPQSFAWVCGVLDLPPEKVRKWVDELMEDSVPGRRKLDQIAALVAQTPAEVGQLLEE